MSTPKTVEMLTVGYEGRDLEDFVRLLQAARVDLLVDARHTPLSRKKGFSKTPLSERLKAAGIDYVHYKEVGTPKAWRDEYKQTKDAKTMLKKYDRFLDEKAEPMHTIYRLAANHRLALLCYEADPALCHRSVLARRIAEGFTAPYRIEVVDL